MDSKGRSPLSLSVLGNHSEVAEALLRSQADPRVTDNTGRNAVHYCVQPVAYGSYENAWLLSQLLAVPGGKEAASAADASGTTPLKLAAEQGSGRMAERFARVGLVCPKVVLRPRILPLEPNRAPSVDVEKDALAEMERAELSAKPTPVPVHEKFPQGGEVRGETRVWAETAGAEYDAMLFKVDLRRDEMRFYHLQLVYEPNRDLYVLFTRWGEIGETGMFQRTPAANKEEGLKEFGKVFKEKTGNVWGAEFEKKPNKYQILKRRRTALRSEDLLRPFGLKDLPEEIDPATGQKKEIDEIEKWTPLPPCSLPWKLKRTVDCFCDPVQMKAALGELGVRTQSMPFGTLTRATLQEARALLGQIRSANDEMKALRAARPSFLARVGYGMPTLGGGAAPMTAEQHQEAAKKRNEVREKILEFSSRYYELVPRGAEAGGELARPLERDEDLAKEFTKLLELEEASAGTQVLMGAHHHSKTLNPLDYCFNALGVTLEALDTASDEFNLLIKYMQKTCNSGAPPVPAEPTDFPGPGDDGSKWPAPERRKRRPGDTVTAIYRLARHGEGERFKALHNRRLLWHGSRRSNVIGILSQGLRIAPPEAPVSGYMFGKGIYFADMFSKSRAYCRTGTNEPAYMLLCEVALGDLYPSCNALYMEQPQPNSHSTWGVGQNSPDWSKCMYEPGGAQVPESTQKEQSGGFSLSYNEFIVYDPAQVRMRYLVELNNFECPEEAKARRIADAEARKEKLAKAEAAKRARRN